MQLTALQEKWLQELESGKHTQGKMHLRTVDEKFCCLGIACEFVLKIPAILNDSHLWKCYDYDGYSGGIFNFIPLGLYGNIGEIKGDHIDSFYDVLKSFGYTGMKQTTLGYYNDQNATFIQIASAIRQFPEADFTPV